ncbi:hypothetical protein ACIRL2_28095 [Embleya sp. NPDC127516]|uniref:hypothetical protein n=1 Tax=Embleya sp. NPDC127516 TaxID=3363990 RepID=UPI0038239367
MTRRSELPGTTPADRRWAPGAESGAVRGGGHAVAGRSPDAECFAVTGHFPGGAR